MSSDECNFRERQEIYDNTYTYRRNLHLRLKYGWMYNLSKYREILIKKVLCDFGVNKKTTILDIGCGGSVFGSIFEPEKCPYITAFDISSKTIEEAKRINPHINYLIGDAQNPKLNSKFDFIHAGEIIEHLSDPKVALKKWCTLLKNDAYMIISTPNSLISRRTKEHISLLSIKQMKEYFKENNLKLIKVVGIDLFIPFFGSESIGERFLMKLPSVSNKYYDIEMKLPYYLPYLARDVMYVTRKVVLE